MTKPVTPDANPREEYRLHVWNRAGVCDDCRCTYSGLSRVDPCPGKSPSPETHMISTSLWDQLIVLSGYHITRPPTPDHEFVHVSNGDLRKMVDLMEQAPSPETQVQGDAAVLAERQRCAEIASREATKRFENADGYPAARVHDFLVVARAIERGIRLADELPPQTRPEVGND